MITKHKDNIIELRNIHSLSGLNFYIPDYQRGYRWTSTQALAMLDDFKKYIKAGKNNKVNTEGFYCLQPIVVRPRLWKDKDGNQVTGYEVIDGQQRLTTIFLLLTALFCKDERNRDEVKEFSMFSISYQTKEDSKEYLDKISDEEYRRSKRLDGIDFYHINMVFEAFKESLITEGTIGIDRSLVELILGEEIKPFVDGEEDDDDEENEAASGNLTDHARNVRVIWYEIGEDEKATAEDIFTRLNIGKIPLTNAELIKAMFLKESNFGKITTTNEKEQKAQQLGIALQQNKIAEDWNVMEQKLQREDFWYFLGANSFGKDYETRIEFIFDLMSGWDSDKEIYHTFNYFTDRIANAGKKKAAENVWKTVKDYIRELEYWYNDRNLYHLIGFLIECGKSIADLLKLREKETTDENGNTITYKLRKDEFLDTIQDEVRKEMSEIDIDTLQYTSKDIQKVLLLFNVLSVIDNQRSDIKFPFDKYKKESWDTEHIASQTDKDKEDVPKNEAPRIAWIDDMLYYFTGMRDKDATDEAGEKLTDPKTKAEFVVNGVTDYIKRAATEIERTTDEDSRHRLTNELQIIRKLLVAKKLSMLTAQQRRAPGQKEEYDNLLKELFRDTKFYFNENRIMDEDKDSLGNMALLNSSINRSYGNAFFAIKRMYIKDYDSAGVFIPIATKNVFMKYYSKRVDNMLIWTNEDAISYVEAIKNKLSDFLIIAKK